MQQSPTPAQQNLRYKDKQTHCHEGMRSFASSKEDSDQEGNTSIAWYIAATDHPSGVSRQVFYKRHG